ncbi:hypothetical protein L1F30_11020 [Simiduia sp. 21SJ11W-1]|uniref:hypothetical protein n=1 Tax=Simiduia sp. 21SJ11W-1 TaxID=2909669 RepID=UPI00209F2234|nr:hypothetical protein [Simiduia sp. 21SJ11W-1]UTA46693.1 hypothetical protein L1F30_11020 [Simiduia sp. 21SJ11W-1]
MSYPLPFSETHRDCLQEVANVAMGAAGESLAEYAGGFVELPIPVIRYLAPKHLYEGLMEQHGQCNVSAAVQSFAGDTGTAYAMVVISDEALKALAVARKLELTDSESEQNLVCALTATVTETCLAMLAELSGRSFTYEPLFIAGMHEPLTNLHLDDLVSLDYVTSVEIAYTLENSPIACDLMLLFPETLNQPLLDLLDQILAQ